VKRILILTILISSGFSKSLMAQSNDGLFYYVVIGGFANKQNAIRYQQKAETDKNLIRLLSDKFSSQFALNKNRNINYVYILKTVDKKQAFAVNIKLKAETEYKDSWVFAGDLDSTGESMAETKPVQSEPSEKADVPSQAKEAVEEKKVASAPPTDSLKLTVEQTTIKTDEPKPVAPATVVEKKPALAGKPFVFKLADKASGKEVKGAAHIYESARAGDYQSFPANQLAYLPEPANTARTYVIKIQAPGYKPADKTIQYGKFDSLKLDQKETVISFELVKVKSGDYIDFNNVHFVKDSPIMKPDSQNELDGLVALMKENSGYKIKIHGFCNGVEKRDVISRGTSEKFFELEPDKNKKQKESAKELSLERAEIVKAYLESQGIEGKRISVKAEGGDIPLYGERSAMAFHNDRIEIEVKSN
jgi:outer membrane protein OmpA-like peptidoglycan-associated protein